MIEILPVLTKEQIEQAKSIKKPKGRYYTEQSYRKAVNAEIDRALKQVESELADKLLGHFMVASLLNIQDLFEPSKKDLEEFVRRVGINYKDITDGVISFDEIRDTIADETGIYIQMDGE